MTSAADYFADEEPDQIRANYAIKADTADDEIPQIVEAITHSEGADLVCLPQYVRTLRDGARDVQRTALHEISQQIRQLRNEQVALIRQISAWGDSAEVLGALTGISAAEVTQLVE